MISLNAEWQHLTFYFRYVSGDRRKHTTQIQIKAQHTWMILESSSKEFLQSPQYSWANWSMYLFTLAEVELIAPLLPDSSWNRGENKKESYMEAAHKNNYRRIASETRTFRCTAKNRGQCLPSLEFCARSLCPLLPGAFQEPPHSLYTAGFPAAVGVPLAGDTLCQPCPGECWYSLPPKSKEGKETLILHSDMIFNSTTTNLQVFRLFCLFLENQKAIPHPASALSTTLLTLCSARLSFGMGHILQQVLHSLAALLRWDGNTYSTTQIHPLVQQGKETKC